MTSLFENFTETNEPSAGRFTCGSYMFIDEATILRWGPPSFHYTQCKSSGAWMCLYKLRRELERESKQDGSWVARGVAPQWFGKRSQF